MPNIDYLLHPYQIVRIIIHEVCGSSLALTTRGIRQWCTNNGFDTSKTTDKKLLEKTLRASLAKDGIAAFGVIGAGLMQYIAIVSGESSNNGDEAAGIGSVLLNRIEYKNTSLSDPNFVDKIGGSGQFDAIGQPIYNAIMAMTKQDLGSPTNPYRVRIDGAMKAVEGRKTPIDYSKGAYFWNASSPQTGFNWKMQQSGTFTITVELGETTFFKYTDASKKWP